MGSVDRRNNNQVGEALLSKSDGNDSFVKWWWAERFVMIGCLS